MYIEEVDSTTKKTCLVTTNLPPLELQQKVVQLQHHCNTSSPNCNSLLQQVMRRANLRVRLQFIFHVAISSVAIENVAIELLQLTML